jgi:hypothetical protein
MRGKWRRAALRPWAPVPPDPDEPTDDRIVKKLEFPRALPFIKDDVKFLAIDPPPDR